jgi:hypothetical protein
VQNLGIWLLFAFDLLMIVPAMMAIT